MSTPPELITRYLDCGTSVIKESVEGAGFGPITNGCTQITYERYVIRLAEIRGEVGETRAAMIAADEQAAAEAAAMLVTDGPVTDADFPEGTTLVDGAMGVDAKNGRIYVRLAGEWKSAALT